MTYGYVHKVILLALLYAVRDIYKYVQYTDPYAPLKDLKDFMRQAGDITYADAHKTRVGEGYI